MAAARSPNGKRRGIAPPRNRESQHLKIILTHTPSTRYSHSVNPESSFSPFHLLRIVQESPVSPTRDSPTKLASRRHLASGGFFVGIYSKGIGNACLH